MSPLVCPYPPTVNNLFIQRGKMRIRSPKYREWADRAALVVLSQRYVPVAGQFHFTLVAQRPDNRKRDLDNLAKSVLDLMRSCGLIEDDSMAQSIHLEWSMEKPRKDATVSITIEPVEIER